MTETGRCRRPTDVGANTAAVEKPCAVAAQAASVVTTAASANAGDGVVSRQASSTPVPIVRAFARDGQGGRWPLLTGG
jgi:hypothetical protein